MRGRAHVFRQPRITTEDILPARYGTADGREPAAVHVLEGVDPGFAARARSGDVLVAGDEFGAGPAREQAVWALRDARLGAVIARSFGRGFYRDALNNGFLVVECAEALERIENGDLLEIDLQEGVVKNLTRGTSFKFTPFTPFAMEILEAGGLLPYVLRQTTGASSA